MMDRFFKFAFNFTLRRYIEARAAAEVAARTSADAADAREAALTVGRCRLTL
jgi:hypothetical protein